MKRAELNVGDLVAYSNMYDVTKGADYLLYAQLYLVTDKGNFKSNGEKAAGSTPYIKGKQVDVAVLQEDGSWNEMEVSDEEAVIALEHIWTRWKDLNPTWQEYYLNSKKKHAKDTLLKKQLVAATNRATKLGNYLMENKEKLGGISGVLAMKVPKPPALPVYRVTCTENILLGLLEQVEGLDLNEFLEGKSIG